MEPELQRVEFQAWPKIPRLNRDMVITEKIDGTNACIIIEAADDQACEAYDHPLEYDVVPTAIVDGPDSELYAIWTQSRKRMIQPDAAGGKGSDNAGFAVWVKENAEALLHLGGGRHYGEWWGKGIQRGYGLDGKHFSLFNVARASYRAAVDGGVLPENVHLVPVLERYTFDQAKIAAALERLRETGSIAASEVGVTGVTAEGIVVFHAAARQLFKVTLEGDEKPKGQS